MRLIRDNVVDFAEYLRKTPKHAGNVRRPSDYAEEVQELFRYGHGNQGTRLPWHKLSRFRIRPAELTVWAGPNGHRKSLAVGQAMLGLMAQGETVLIASFEMPPAVTLHRLARQALGSWPPVEHRLQAITAWLDERLWILDHLGTMGVEDVVGLGHYAARELDVQHLVVDSLTMLRIAAAGDSALNDQKRTVEQLVSLARDSGLHVHLVCHARKGRTEHEPIGKWDVRGAGEITDLAHNVVLVQRTGDYDSDRPEDMPDQFLTVAKQRNGAWEGRAGLWWDPQSLQLLDRQGQPPVPYDHIRRYLAEEPLP